MWALKPNHTILVRTQCDKVTDDDEKTIEEEIQSD